MLDEHGRLLDPSRHSRALHDPNSAFGSVTIGMSRSGDWTEKHVPISNLTHVARSLAGLPETYILYNRTRVGSRSRQAQNIVAFPHVFIDLDLHKSEFSSEPPDSVAPVVLTFLEQHRIPAPSFVMNSGRGLHLVWTLETPLPAKAQPRWRAVERYLVRLLIKFAADPSATDPARVLRLGGTLNSKSQTIAHVVGGWGDPIDFEDLANAVLPLTRDELRQLEQDRSNSKALTKTKDLDPILKRMLFEQVHLARQEDYWKLIKLRFADHLLPPGQRDVLLFLFAVTVSWLDPTRVSQIMIPMARDLAGWTAAETVSRLGTVIRNAIIDAKSLRSTCRYKFRNETIINRLAITEDEMVAGDFRSLLSPRLKRERKLRLQRARETEARRSAGQMKRQDYIGTSEARNRPWKKYGVSKRSYYRRKSEGTLDDLEPELGELKPLATSYSSSRFTKIRFIGTSLRLCMGGFPLLVQSTDRFFAITKAFLKAWVGTKPKSAVSCRTELLAH